MNAIEFALKHMAWSNQEIFKAIEELPEEIYGLSAAENEWTVGRLLTHFIGAAEWYRYCLTGQKWEDIVAIRSHEILKSQAIHLGNLDSVLIDQASLPDENVSYVDESGPKTVLRSLILAQTVSHTAEHKGQIAAILKMNRHHLDLDKYDVWSYQSFLNKK